MADRRVGTLKQIRRILAVGPTLIRRFAAARTAFRFQTPRYFQFTRIDKAPAMRKLQAFLAMGRVITIRPAFIRPATSPGAGLAYKFARLGRFFFIYEAVGLAKGHALLGMRNILAVGPAFRLTLTAARADGRQFLNARGLIGREKAMGFAECETGVLVAQIITVLLALVFIGAVFQLRNGEFDIKRQTCRNGQKRRRESDSGAKDSDTNAHHKMKNHPPAGDLFKRVYPDALEGVGRIFLKGVGRGIGEGIYGFCRLCPGRFAARRLSRLFLGNTAPIAVPIPAGKPGRERNNDPDYPYPTRRLRFHTFYDTALRIN